MKATGPRAKSTIGGGVCGAFGSQLVVDEADEADEIDETDAADESDEAGATGSYIVAPGEPGLQRAAQSRPQRRSLVCSSRPAAGMSATARSSGARQCRQRSSKLSPISPQSPSRRPLALNGPRSSPMAPSAAALTDSSAEELSDVAGDWVEAAHGALVVSKSGTRKPSASASNAFSR